MTLENNNSGDAPTISEQVANTPLGKSITAAKDRVAAAISKLGERLDPARQPTAVDENEHEKV